MEVGREQDRDAVRLAMAFKGRWYIARYLRLGMGLLATAMGIADAEWPLAVIGVVLLAQAAWNVGCGMPGASCSIEQHERRSGSDRA